MLRTFLFMTKDTQFEIVATGIRDACETLEEQFGKISIHDILAVEEHFAPSENDTVH